jgi:hypothetical protein
MAIEEGKYNGILDLASLHGGNNANSVPNWFFELIYIKRKEILLLKVRNGSLLPRYFTPVHRILCTNKKHQNPYFGRSHVQHLKFIHVYSK